MLTDPGDIVVDPFAGSCVTGEVAERLDRKWICSEIVEEYVKGGISRFQGNLPNGKTKVPSYSVYNPSVLWNGIRNDDPLFEDGGKKRSIKR